MSELKIITFPDSILRKPAARVNKVNEAIKEILEDMVKTMYLNNGVGLAAVQVGIDKQLAVVDVGGGIIKLINPVIVKKHGVEAQEEGCLSVPEVTVKIKRAKLIAVHFLDENGDAKQLKAEGLLARAIQHEVDHLSGVLIIDYLGPIKRMLAKKKLAGRKKKKPLTKPI